MAQPQHGRHTHDHRGTDGGSGTDAVAVFHIGMRVNRPWRPDLWLPVVAAMPRMLAELSRERSRGLLGYRMLFGAGGPTVVQYWRSAQPVYDYAADPRAQHRRRGRRSTGGRAPREGPSASGTRPAPCPRAARR